MGSDIDTIEEFTFAPKSDRPFADWRRYRIEYGGHAQDCVMEGIIYLPPNGDPDAIVQLILGMEEHGKQWKTLTGTDPVEEGET